jgi:hypothetical protein
MRKVAVALALLGAQFAAPVAAEPVAGQFKTWGECVSAYHHNLVQEWKDDGKSVQLKDFDPSMWCIWTGEAYVLMAPAR